MVPASPSLASPPPWPVPETALVTGAGKRIGRAVALDLAASGFAVAVHYHRGREDAGAVVDHIRRRGGRAQAFAADLADPEAADALLPEVARALGPVGCLVNNASLFNRDEVPDVTRESWNAHLAVNLTAPFFLTQAFARQLPPDRGGVAVNLLDQRVWNLTPHFVSYTAAKAGLWALTQSLALALAPRIRVNGIGPGPVLPSRRQSDAQFAAQWRQVPLERPAGLAEIAGAVRFILETPSLTGQMIALDGGQHLGWRQLLDADPEE